MGNSSSKSSNDSENKSWFSWVGSKPATSSTPSTIFGTPTATTTPPATTPATTPSIFGTSTTTGGKTRRKKRSTKNNKTKGKINFSKIKWGSFTKIYNNYIKTHPNMMSQLPDLKHFAHYVNKHPNQFTKKTHKKALFYTNIIEK
jgi:hypothetical protein